jgi:AcrR family transcriptional regulator
VSQFTKKAIRDSFTNLLNKYPLDKIKVKDVVEECGINRNTFYYYYHDIYDLLSDLFKFEAERIISSGYTSVKWQEGVIKACSFALENKRAVYHIYNSMNRKLLEDYLREVVRFIMTNVVHDIGRGMDVAEADMSIIVDFYTFAVDGFMLDWLEKGMREDPEPFITRLGDILEGNIKISLERAENG